MSDSLKKVEEVRNIIKDLLAEKEEEAKLAKAEEVVQSAESTISELTEAVASKEEEVSNLAGEKEDLNNQINQLKTQITELENKLTESSENLEQVKVESDKAKSELASMVKDRQLEVRMRELTEAKVARAGDKLEAQKQRVRDMDDDAFTAYKSDLIDIRSELANLVKKEAEKAENLENHGDAPVVEIAPANIEPTNKEAAAAALNVENASDNNNKWTAFGEALAKQMRSNQE